MKKYSLIFFLLLWIFNYKIFAAPKLTLESSAFKNNSMIPAQFTCEGQDISPPLAWNNVPSKTKSFALVVEDPDAPSGVFTHWMIVNIPSTLTKLDLGTLVPEGAIAVNNSMNSTNYHGPCPKTGAHHYVFKLFSLDKELSLGAHPNRDEVLQAMTGHVLEEAQLGALFQK